MDPLAPGLLVLSRQGLSKGKPWAKQMDRSDIMRAQHDLLRRDASGLSTDHGCYFAAPVSDRPTLPGGNGDCASVLRILVLCGTSYDSLAFLRVGTFDALHYG